jgi:segregation and condensation protein B
MGLRASRGGQESLASTDLVVRHATVLSFAAMPEPHRPDPRRKPAEADGNPPSSPLSLDRLRAAFAQMLGAEPEQTASTPIQKESPRREAKSRAGSEVQTIATPDPCEISPRTVVEAMLFVGRADDRPFSARELAAAMRGVSPAEIEAAVAELNQVYERDAASYKITSSSEGFRLALRDDFTRMRDKFHGRLREAKLSPATVEVLSVVAYHQPTTAEAINELRGTSSGAALAWLVRRKLVRIDRQDDRGAKPTYSTTDRFLRLFGLENVAALPRSEELDKI